MVRIKNAITGHFIAEVPEGETAPTYLELANFITTVTNDTSEDVESVGYYSGDGTEQDEVTGIKFSYAFEGFYDATDAAQKFVADREFDINNRKVLYKQVRSDGTEYAGPATLSEIKVTGGDATEYEPFECTISWDKVPVKTPPTPIVP